MSLHEGAEPQQSCHVAPLQEPGTDKPSRERLYRGSVHAVRGTGTTTRKKKKKRGRKKEKKSMFAGRRVQKA